MDAGALDQKIELQAPIVSTDELGAKVSAWSTVSSPWAKVMETPGREFLSGDYRAEEKTVFVVRWRAVDSTSRVSWGGRTWRIDSVTGTRREGFAYLHCRAADGAN
jgi:SPP1 family predicted phage head-tail adaptor